MEKSLTLRLKGWQIWYFQNLLFLVLSVFLLINYFFITVAWWLGDLLGALVNFLFIICMSSDIFAMAFISTGLLTQYYHETKRGLKDTRRLLTAISGLLWLGCSLGWRYPLYFQNAYKIGVGIRFSPTSRLSFLPSGLGLLTNSVSLTLFLFGSGFLLAFFVLNERLPEKNSNILIGRFYGGVNLLSNLILLVLIISSAGFSEIPYPIGTLLIFSVLSLKFFLVPGLGMRTARRHATWLSVGEDPSVPGHIGVIAVPSSAQSPDLPHHSQHPRRMKPSRRTSGILIGIVLFWVLMPVSPAFIGNWYPASVLIEGPYISREAAEEALEALRVVEALPAEALGSPIPPYSFLYSDYVVVNETLEFFLTKITSGNSIGGKGGLPYSYKLNWTVSVEEAEIPEINSSTLEWYWTREFHRNAQLTRLLRWDNSTRVDVAPEPHPWIFTLNETVFQNFSRPAKWVFYGELVYDETSGSLACHSILVHQLLFLDENLDFVSGIIEQNHGVC